ncbi:MAG TPA: ribonuclease H-like domain-containing protein, partial [Acidimicrobiales bacterium]
MKTLLLDIETSPNVAYTWGLFDQNVGLNQLVSTTEVICFAAKWQGQRKMHFFSDFHDGHEDMVLSAHALLDEADVVVHYNGTKFDIPHLNREFITALLPPPSPFKQIDLWRVVRQRFKFASTKLAHVAPALGLEGKTSHEGFDLWRKCMAGDEAAWRKMRTYNRRDVELLE